MRPFYLLLTFTYCAGIFFLSSSANPVGVPYPGLNLDKLFHALLYAGLAITVSVGIRRSRENAGPWVQYLAPLLFASLYGMSDEFHQLFVPGRQCDPWDLAADFTGAFVVQTVLCWRVWRVWK